MFCQKCGNMLIENAKFCVKCGCKVEEKIEIVQEENEKVLEMASVSEEKKEKEPVLPNVSENRIKSENKEIHMSRSTVILAVILVVVVFVFVVVGMKMHAESVAKDSVINEYQQQQESYNNRTSGEKAADGIGDIIDAIGDAFE